MNKIALFSSLDFVMLHFSNALLDIMVTWYSGVLHKLLTE